MAANVGDLTGRVVVITGASSGIGLAAAIGLAARGATTAIVGRSEERLTRAAELVRDAAPGRPPVAFRADFEHLDDVHVLVDRLSQRFERIDVLANNAGGVVKRGTITGDGFEATIQSNHLAAFLLSNLLREQLRNGRIITTASAAHMTGRINPDDLAGRNRSGLWRAYGSAKQANILFAAEAARRWPDILSASFHPGFVKTRFGAAIKLNLLVQVVPFGRTPEVGADTLQWLATTPVAELTNGGYYSDRQLRTPAAQARDAALAGQLWEASRAAVGLS